MNPLEKLSPVKPREEVADFRPGDTVRVHVRIREGEKERVQAFEGTVIARKHQGLDADRRASCRERV